MSQKFNGIPVGIIHFDKDYNITSKEFYNLENVVPDKWALDAFARAILPDIQKFYECEENVQAFEEWKKEQEKKNKEKPHTRPRRKKRAEDT